MDKITEWNNINDSEPINRNEVLCLNNKHEMSVLVFKHGCFFDGLERVTNVMYWMNLPDFPKGYPRTRFYAS